jgi:hypothetical protein
VQDRPVQIVRGVTAEWPPALRERAKLGWLPLHFAAQAGDLETVQYLASQHPGALLERTSTGVFPLHLSLHPFASVEVVRYLARREPRALRVMPGSGNDGRYLPLHHAAAREAPLEVTRFVANECLEALQVRECDWGFCPVHVAAASNLALDVVYTLARMGPSAIVPW